jgi:predicted AlkP superfamily phosphohydrolase/phosphomutase
LAQELSDRLLELRDPKTERRVVDRVVMGRDVFEGPLADNGPDLIAQPAEDYTFGAPSLVAHRTPFTDIDFELEIPGGHHPEGILIWSGAGVRPSQDVRANLSDVAPTVLARSGAPVPDHMDGRVLSDLFTSPPTVIFQSWESGGEEGISTDYSAAEEEQLRQRLRDLGYL